MFAVALALFILLGLAYLFFAGAIVYHLKKYRIEHDLSRMAMYLFVFVSLLLLASAFLIFITTPWQDIYPSP